MKNHTLPMLILLITATAGIGYFVWQQQKAKPTTMMDVATEQKIEQAADQQPSEAQVGYVDLAPAEAKKLIEQNPDLIIIDVSPKYNQGHLPGSINYYVGDGSLDRAIPNLNQEATYLVYCHVDSASIAGAKKLVEAGFKNVYRLKGNYAAWVEAGYEVVK
ncbi:MAG: hypothetical protein GF390_00480 [Candidatus Pacebacteria bacterium]|nr:hypothetical protein [Candidatus Paceibacterota bacterium]